jgi:protocatechuate 3,4-dioxygenase beta subunit
MYFPSDPLFRYDPILQSVTDQAARDRLIATYRHDLSQPEFSMGYEWDIVLDGPSATWIEEGRPA